MPPFKASLLAAVALLTAAAAAAATLLARSNDPPRAGLEAAAQARLAGYRHAPQAAGELVYRGDVFAQDRREREGEDPSKAGAAALPLFTYERRVSRRDDGTTIATHLTRTPGGEVVIAEAAQFGPGYRLQRFEAANAQLGLTGSAVLGADGRRIDYRLDDNGRVSTAVEEVDAPVVTGPSLHGFILEHWSRLEAGARVPVRFVVLAEKQTYGFEIRRVQRSASAVPGRPGTTSFSITPTNALVRLAVAPLTVTFDDATRHVVRYEGRVPPQREVRGRLEALDARVDYTMALAGYR